MYQSTDQLIDNSPLFPPAPFTVETLLEQGSGELNEDVLLRKGNLFGVFDGATSLAKQNCGNGLTGGLLAAQLAAQAFHNQMGNLYLSAKKANLEIFKAFSQQNHDGSQRHQLWSTSAAVIRLDENTLDYCQTGDSLILVIDKNGNHKVITPHIDHDKETLTLWKQTHGTNGATIQEVLGEQIIKIRQQMNISYGVLNGEDRAMDFLCHGTIDLEDVSDILLFTDGLFLPRKLPGQESNWQGFTELYRQGGLQAVRDHVRNLEEDDPTCREYPRFKQHDDIAAIAIKLHR